MDDTAKLYENMTLSCFCWFARKWFFIRRDSG